jgi:hypothetical protein
MGPSHRSLTSRLLLLDTILCQSLNEPDIQGGRND